MYFTKIQRTILASKGKCKSDVFTKQSCKIPIDVMITVKKNEFPLGHLDVVKIPKMV